MDPRVNIIDKRLEKIKKIIAISGGKGGIGKSTVAVALALTLSKKGYKVGLLDLDLWGTSAHVVMGIGDIYPEEEKGIVPPDVNGVKFMSVVYYTSDRPLPLRKAAFDQAAIELLAVTQWGTLDYLIIDMPPGMADATLDVIRVIKKISFCIVAVPSKVVLETVNKTVKMLKESGAPIIGAIENMAGKESSVREQMKKFDIPFLGKISFDAKLEEAVGNAPELLKTDFVKSISKIIESMDEVGLKRRKIQNAY